MALRYIINPFSRVIWLHFSAVSILILFAAFATASGNESNSGREIPKPSWWGTAESEAKPFLTLKEIVEQYENLDGRLYYTRALRTAERFPDNPNLVLLALYYAPFREGVSDEDSFAVVDYFMEQYFYWKESARRDCSVCETKMVSGVVDGLVSRYCNSGNAQSALGLIDRFLGAEGSAVDFDEQARIFNSLGLCINVESVTADVAMRLEKAHEELSRKVTSDTGKLYVYYINQKVTRHKVEMGEISPCEILRNEVQREKGSAAETYVTTSLQEKADKQDWQHHLSSARRFLPFESEEALALADAIFNDGFYENKLPEWQFKLWLPNLITNMVCVGNERYLSILVDYFYGSNTLNKDEQLRAVLEKLWPTSAGRNPVPLSINWRQNNERADVKYSYSNFVFEKVDLGKQEYWLPTQLEKAQVME